MRVAPALLVLLLFLAPSAYAQQASLSVANYMFSPSRLVVAPGANVTVSNADSEPHAMRTTDGKTNLVSIVDARGTTTFLAPTTPGEYPYYCPFHTSADSTNQTFMKGVLVVQGATASTPAASTTPASTTPSAVPPSTAPSAKTPGFNAVLLVAAMVGIALVAKRR